MQQVTLKGAFSSPYTLKMRAVLRYRRIPYRWVLRGSQWDDLPEAPVPVIPVTLLPPSGDPPKVGDRAAGCLGVPTEVPPTGCHLNIRPGRHRAVRERTGGDATGHRDGRRPVDYC